MNGEHYNNVGSKPIGVGSVHLNEDCVVVCLFNLLMVWGHVQQLTDMDLRVRGSPFSIHKSDGYGGDPDRLHACARQSRSGTGCMTLQVIQPLLGHMSLRELMTAALRFASGEVFFANGHSSLTLMRHYLMADESGDYFLTICIMPRRFPRGSEFLSTSARGEREFRDRFRILNDVSILLVEGEPMTSENLSHNATYFTKEQFNAMLHFPLPSLLIQFLHFTKIPLAFLYSNVIRVLMGCSVLDMLYHFDLSLLETLFVYIVKMSQNERFSLSAHTPSLQLVTGLPNSNKAGQRGTSLSLALGMFFLFGCEPIADLSCLCGVSKNKRGCHVKFVEKASFDRLNKIFEISSIEQNHQVLLTDKNLEAVVKES
ncbi:hypothetical protein CK203_061953 [Vitis vinifera]|uniref:Uncharacterized protein n=1 Tax=Vitis vinifera TaxID=29760 RepID=A0A438GF20_VITVI|nr:hypothetical protein CK203_061953 [Vitis vinifera]